MEKKHNTKINVEAITLSVGEFIRQLRNGKKRPSMEAILRKNGVKSPLRAQSLVKRMIENNIIKVYQDGSYHLTQINYDSHIVMPLLLTKEVKEKTITDSLAKFSAKELVEELRRRNYEVICEKTIVESL
jgi:hypothetical protein